tara:strand:- start:4675 stop:5292 length:618 start_codon:yes stop_codon:yes gene_type:complete
MNINIKLHKNDLPDDLKLDGEIASDAEFLGLNPPKDKLCLIQLNQKDKKEVHVVQLDRKTYKAPNLSKMLVDNNVKKIFHFARKDLEMIKFFLKIDVKNVECTKLQSKLARGYSDQHSYKALVQEFVGINISKAKQSSDWGKKDLDPDQLKYSATDVIHLHRIHEELNKILLRENRMELYKDAINFLKVRVDLDIFGISEDIWSH